MFDSDKKTKKQEKNPKKIKIHYYVQHMIISFYRTLDSHQHDNLIKLSWYAVIQVPIDKYQSIILNLFFDNSLSSLTYRILSRILICGSISEYFQSSVLSISRINSY
ncbi:hypothetical protein BpHYR1_019148 [Brachionus plicatilis]|uniref:Uncharacterized protein n=1 Tax=Brachionus plicatilis TaxID=10195 RepID=A0A3M7PSB3_BRAPC|nr:hypothetical protein BpHYR1_019148 [Brachionus plicatilis]